MQELLARIGFGCGRLRGGFEESSSRRLLDEALRCGIGYFDTAPSYGASEKILGRGLRGVRSQVQVCTKVGLYASEPSTVAGLRGLVVATVRAILPSAAVDRLKQRRRAAEANVTNQRGYGNFDPTLIRRSVERSLEALETGFLDCLMLHEPSMEDPTPEVAQLMGELVGEGKTVRIGVGTHSRLEELPQFGDVAQFAVGRSVRNVGDARTFIGHGLFRRLDSEVFELCVRDAGILQTLPALKRYLSDPLGISALLLNAVLFGTNIDRVLVSTASPGRLRKFILTAADVYGDIQAHHDREIDKNLRQSIHQYFANERL
jgi:Aldo/keto reductase family